MAKKSFMVSCWTSPYCSDRPALLPAAPPAHPKQKFSLTQRYCCLSMLLIAIISLFPSPARADWDEDDWEDLGRRAGRRVVREINREIRREVDIDRDDWRDAREEIEEEIEDWDRVVKSDWDDGDDDAQRTYRQVRRSARRVKRIVDILD